MAYAEWSDARSAQRRYARTAKGKAARRRCWLKLNARRKALGLTWAEFLPYRAYKQKPKPDTVIQTRPHPPIPISAWSRYR